MSGSDWAITLWWCAASGPSQLGTRVVLSTSSGCWLTKLLEKTIGKWRFNQQTWWFNGIYSCFDIGKLGWVILRFKSLYTSNEIFTNPLFAADRCFSMFLPRVFSRATWVDVQSNRCLCGNFFFNVCCFAIEGYHNWTTNANMVPQTIIASWTMSQWSIVQNDGRDRVDLMGCRTH